MAFGALKGTLTGNTTDIAASNSIAGSVVVAVDDLVFALSSEQNGLTSTTVSDNLGNTYTATNAGTDDGTITGRAYYSRVTVAGTLTSVAVVATSGSNNWSGAAAVIEGPFAASPLDANPANGTGGAVTTFTCPATGTLAQADEVVMCWGNTGISGDWTATSPNILAVSETTRNPRSHIGYQVVSATTSVSPEFTGASSNAYVLGTSSFKKEVTVVVGFSYGIIIG